MNLFDYDLTANADAGFSMKVRSPLTGEESDAVIHLVGSDSKSYRRVRTEVMRKHAKLGSEDKDYVADVDTVNAEVYSKCITGWDGMSGPDGLIEFSEVKALELLTKFAWLCDQVAGAVDNRLNFTKLPTAN